MPNPKESGLSDNSIGCTRLLHPIPGHLLSRHQALQQAALCAIPLLAVPRLQRFCLPLLYIQNFVLGFSMFLEHRPLLGLWWLVELIWVAIFLVWLWCIVGALNGRRCKLPIIGPWADEQAYR